MVVLAWLATTAALIAVLFLTAIDTMTGRWFSAADADSINPEAVVIADPDLGNSVTYGSVQWRLLQTRLVPRSYDDTFSRPVVIIEATATNLSPKVAVRAHARDMSLVLEDGQRVSIHRFEHTPSTERVELGPGQSLPVTLVFKPVLRHDPYLDHLVLEIQEANRYPAQLALDGSTGSVLYPRSLNVAPASDEAIAITEARLDVNADAYRARSNERLIVIEVEVDGAKVAANTGVGPIWPANEYWRLNVTTFDADGAEDDGGADEGEAAPVWRAIEPSQMTVIDRDQQSGDDDRRFVDVNSNMTVLEFVFIVPAGATSNPMALTAGHEDAKVGVVGTGSVENHVVVPGWRW